MFGFGKKKKQVSVLAPFGGAVVPVTEVPDQVFNQRMLGDGFAIVPPADAGVVEVLAPVSGTVKKLFGTKHAVALVTDGGVEVLVHLGLETVELGGEGFEALTETGAQVEAGQPLLRMDVASIRAAGRDPITPVVFTKTGQIASVDIAAGDAPAGQAVCTAALA